MKKILFIDRDGTLVAEPEDEQVDRLDKIDFEPQVIPSLLALQKAGYTLVMVTNQDGLGTESYPREDFDLTHGFIMNLFESQGVRFDEVLICPHTPKDNCDCRKPKIGLVRGYLASNDWDRANSYVIGDRETDLQLAKNMGIEGLRYARTAFTWSDMCDRLTGKTRVASVTRNTRETQIDLTVDLDHAGKNDIHTGIGFFDHMLEQIATHGAISMKLQVNGDLEVDEHHTVEDVGLALGEAIKTALGDKRGIRRFGYVLAMDEVEAHLEAQERVQVPSEVTMDISGRPYFEFSCEANFMRESVGEMATEMVPHFFRSLAYAMGLTLHMKVTDGNTHHQVEALFKAFGRALRDCVRIEGDALPSSKGVL